ncbi:hypothetical protein [Bradyrhizobium sp. SZCCHNRI1003]|uniref:hypothetical protein n=1 Tax=Bradyrhizobium sp. SZCCHNRI1003 TaxID=3057275 RepID=UPI002915C5EF|nr:hypothetical protein [Bradyrhizobium sp. SZCCHNRI1003]
MAKLSSAAREQLAAKRLLRVISSLTMANQRTLEQKISDAGPFNQRIDPHVLNDARKQLLKDGQIGRLQRNGTPWFYAGNTPIETQASRLQELLAVYQPYLKIAPRIGQALEIATYRALRQIPNADFYGRFKDLDAHDDSTMYSKEEPPQHIGNKELTGDERLDFILRTPDAGAVGIECKNVRHWMYPHVDEIRETLRKCLLLDAVPVLIARRIPFVTFAVLGKCGLIIHQTYNQLLPASETELAAKVRDKTLLGYHDVRTTNQPDARLVQFITKNLPAIAPAARAKYEQHTDLLWDFAFGEKTYVEFSARVLRRSRGEDEDGPYKQLMEQHNMTYEEVLKHFFGQE